MQLPLCFRQRNLSFRVYRLAPGFGNYLCKLRAAANGEDGQVAEPAHPEAPSANNTDCWVIAYGFRSGTKRASVFSASRLQSSLE